MKILETNIVTFYGKLFFITKTRKLERAAQALAPREHEIHAVFFVLS